MPLSREQFSALRAKGLSVEQIARFDKGGTQKPGATPLHTGYSGESDLPIERDPLMDPTNILPMIFGGGALGLGAKSATGAAGKALTSGAATPLLRHAGTAAGVSVGAGLGGPGGAALGGIIGRQVLSPRTIEKLLQLLARRAAPASPWPASIANAPAISQVMRGGVP